MLCSNEDDPTTWGIYYTFTPPAPAQIPPKLVYVGKLWFLCYSTYGFPLVVSKDAKTWTTTSARNIVDVSYDGVKKVYYAASSLGDVMVSSNGRTWKQLVKAPLKFRNLLVDFAYGNDVLVLATPKEVYVTSI